jgi:predicted TIM-barrel fold metal-dependent hydrolase
VRGSEIESVPVFLQTNSRRDPIAVLPFVDSHIHYWDLQDPALHYAWLQPDSVHPILGNIDGLKVLRYAADEYIAETRFQNVAKAIHVQAAVGIDDPVEETRWLQEQAERTGFPHGIVGHCDLAADDATDVLDRHLEYPNFRGIRDFGAAGGLHNPSWREGYGRLAERNLVFCMDVEWEGMTEALALANDYGDVTLCVDHAGFPKERTAAYLENWRRGMQTIASAPNTVCKISGLAMGDNNWTVESLRPWVEGCIEAFGVERCFFGTNWPVDRLYSSFGDVVDAYAEIISAFSKTEQSALFSGNAERIFRV